MQKLKTELEPILSKKEIEVVIKRLNNKHLTQTESNYMSRSIRPKLKAARFAANSDILSMLDYRRNKYERQEKELTRMIIESMKPIIHDVKAIMLFGSYVRNKHTQYRDIDVMVAVKKKLWKNEYEKNKIKKEAEKRCCLKLDIQMMEAKWLRKAYPYSSALQTELQEYETIYGRITLPKNRIINKQYLYRELLHVDIIIEMNKSLEAKYTYNALRTALAIQLFLDKKVDNRLIIKTIENNIGGITANALQNNTANKIQREMALRYLKYLYKELEGRLR